MTFRKTIFAFAMTAAVLTGCAKAGTAGKNDAAKRYFDAWMLTHHPDAQKTFPGFYIIEDVPGTGASIEDTEAYPYLRVNYTARDLQGNVKNTTVASLAQQLGTYSEADYYGPYFMYRANNNLEVGVDAVLKTMKVGGKRTAIIPGWLSSYDRYDTEEDYLKNASGTDYIYTFEVVEAVPDVQKWEIRQVEDYILSRYGAAVDSTGLGFYYVKAKDCTDTTSFKENDKVYFNYTGRLLSGKVFDTTIADTAKVHGIYNASNSYSPTYVTWPEKYEDMTMGSNESDVIDGFKKTIFGMKMGEQGTGIFISDRGYSYNGSSTTIPAYAPLVFEIEIVKKD